MNVIRQIMKAALIACVSRRRIIARGPRSVDQRPKLALTFDDGPHPEHTARLLDRLNELGLTSTFFVVGQLAEKYPELISRMAAEGHEVANHTWSHSEPRSTSAAMFLAEIEQTDRQLSSLTGHPTKTVRPPKGELNWAKLQGVWQENKTVALWNVDPKDFRMKSRDEMTTWCQTYEPRDGDIVLLHDVHPYALQAVETMALMGTFERFETTTISNWLDEGAVKPGPVVARN